MRNFRKWREEFRPRTFEPHEIVIDAFRTHDRGATTAVHGSREVQAQSNKRPPSAARNYRVTKGRQTQEDQKPGHEQVTHPNAAVLQTKRNVHNGTLADDRGHNGIDQQASWNENVNPGRMPKQPALDSIAVLRRIALHAPGRQHGVLAQDEEFFRAPDLRPRRNAFAHLLEERRFALRANVNGFISQQVIRAEFALALDAALLIENGRQQWRSM